MALLVYPYFWMNSEDAAGLIVSTDGPKPASKESLMGIGVDITSYKNYDIAGPFLDPFVSERKIEQLDYFDGVSGLYYGITSSEPDLIYDEAEVVSILFQRFPKFAKAYEQSAANHYKKISN